MKYTYGFVFLFLFVVLKVQGRTHTQRRTHSDATLGAKPCNSINFTFVFVIDVSSSISPEQWTSEKEIVKHFVKSSSFGVNKNVDVAVVTFSNDAVLDLSCGQLTTKNNFISFMDKLPLRGGATSINRGLLKAREAYKSCPKDNHYPVVILLTDGSENIDNRNSERFLTETQIKSEALLIAGAVYQYKKDEIDRITSYIVNGNKVSYDFFADNFDSLVSNFGSALYPFVLQRSQCKSLLSAWGEWEACSASCQIGYTPPTQTRSRQCSGFCKEYLTDIQNCNEQEICPGTISEWGSWSECSASCNTLVHVPFQTRSRNCKEYSWWDPSYNGCPGIDTSDQRLCNEKVVCPVPKINRKRSRNDHYKKNRS